MNFERRKKIPVDNSVRLDSLKGGAVFHFADMTYDTAVAEDAIFMVVAGGKDNRTQIACIKDGLLLQRDNCHKVCTVDVTLVNWEE